MENTNEIKEMVRQKYSEIALQDKDTNAASCCGATGCCDSVYSIMADDYTHLEGYTADADLGLGCGLPTQFAKIKTGDVVIDLGSGAGNDCFIARHETGPEGKVVKKLWIEEANPPKREMYLSYILDRSSGYVALLA